MQEKEGKGILALVDQGVNSPSFGTILSESTLL